MENRHNRWIKQNNKDQKQIYFMKDSTIFLEKYQWHFLSLINFGKFHFSFNLNVERGSLNKK